VFGLVTIIKLINLILAFTCPLLSLRMRRILERERSGDKLEGGRFVKTQSFRERLKKRSD
jgi:hypothetical protein